MEMRTWRVVKNLRSRTIVAVSANFHLCHKGCGKENKLDRDSVIRCIYCSHRIFYKKREKKII
jgi:DNA-directed RNA polymerase subunit RPC12/RpoP